MKSDFSREVQNKYRSLLRAGSSYLSRSDQQDIRQALNIAIQAYGQKETAFGEPIILHSLSVARLVCQYMGLGSVSIIGALLHDAGPYLNEHKDEILSRLGKPVLEVLEGLEKIQDLHTEKTKYQAEIFRKLLLQLAADIRVILIKLVERLDEMRKLDQAPEEIRLTVSSETYYLYAPLAHRLGLYNLKSELEDLHLKYTHSEMYNTIVSRLRQTTSSRNKLIRDFLKPVRERLDKDGLEYIVKSRTKSVHSIWKKMTVQQVDFDEVYDLFAIRIIIKAERQREKSLCWQVYSVVTDLYQPNPKRMRDWISVPRSNGYESLHTTVVGPRSKWVEVQIRTERMDEIAEKGYAAHFRYKDKDDRGGMDSWLLRMRDILELPAGETDEFFDQVKSGLYADEVFVFTPKGDLKQLPAGASLLDFAFEIHTAIGEKCMGGKVNGRNMPIKYKLKNGDQVSILTSKNQKPKSDWLSFVVTSKARSRIKQLLNEEENKKAEEGKEILQRRLKNWKIVYDDQLMRRLQKHYGCKTGKELYCQISDQVVHLQELKEVLLEKEESTVVSDAAEEKPTKTNTEQERSSYGDLLIIDDKVKNLDYKMAKCCNPVNGDPVFGFVTVDDGIKIHRTACPNASSLLARYPYRVIKARWTRGEGAAGDFMATIRISGIDELGMVNKISETVTAYQKIDIRSMQYDSQHGMFEAIMKVHVPNVNMLNGLIKRISQLKGVMRANRKG